MWRSLCRAHKYLLTGSVLRETVQCSSPLCVLSDSGESFVASISIVGISISSNQNQINMDHKITVSSIANFRIFIKYLNRIDCHHSSWFTSQFWCPSSMRILRVKMVIQTAKRPWHWTTNSMVCINFENTLSVERSSKLCSSSNRKATDVALGRRAKVEQRQICRRTGRRNHSGWGGQIRRSYSRTNGSPRFVRGKLILLRRLPAIEQRIWILRRLSRILQHRLQ